MVELDKAALDEAEHRGDYLLPKELLTFIEEYDDTVDRGIPIERLEAYADALEERGVQDVNADKMDQLVEQDLTDSEFWNGPDAIYQLEDGVSAFPPHWHDELTGEDDLMDYVYLISGDIASKGEPTGTGASGEGVPQDLLLDVASAVGPYSRDGAREELQRLRKEGKLEERADQHPQARVWPGKKEH